MTSRSEAKTKRRKVWVNEYAGDRKLASYVHGTKASALGAMGSDGTAVPFVESRPGDVVLSREQVAHAIELVDSIGTSNPTMRGVRLGTLRAILRGGR